MSSAGRTLSQASMEMPASAATAQAPSSGTATNSGGSSAGPPMIVSPEALASHCAKAAPYPPGLNVVLLAVSVEFLEADHGLESAHRLMASHAGWSPRREIRSDRA